MASTLRVHTNLIQSIRLISFDELGLKEVLRQPKSMAYAEALAKEKWALAVQYCPVDTGQLVSSIHSDVFQTRDGWEVSLWAAAPYAKYVEFGTVRTRAQPFLRPALYTKVGSKGGFYKGFDMATFGAGSRGASYEGTGFYG